MMQQIWATQRMMRLVFLDLGASSLLSEKQFHQICYLQLLRIEMSSRGFLTGLSACRPADRRDKHSEFSVALLRQP